MSSWFEATPGDVDRHLAGLPLVQEVIEAMAVARDDQQLALTRCAATCRPMLMSKRRATGARASSKSARVVKRVPTARKTVRMKKSPVSGSP